MGEPRRQRVVFRAEIEIVVNGTWSTDCTIAQVLLQAERDARSKLDDLRSEQQSTGVYIAAKPSLVRVLLDEAEVSRG